MSDTDLARRPGVELIRTGSWAASTGSWDPTREDILAAVEAQKCPAIRNPIVKLGHTDQRFVGDGEPAMGWFENLRAGDGGHTLIADQVTLPWLNRVQAAAYPDRSIEGNYNHRCSLGHTHKFVITAVALLGVTPPAVSTLKSLQDLPGLLGVAAAQEVPEGARHVQVTIRAATDDQDEDDEARTGAMVALIPTADDAARLAVPGGEPAEELHVTLAYLGKAANLDPAARQDIIDAVSTAVNGSPMVDADAFAVSIFNPPSADDDGDAGRDTCIVLGLGGADLDGVHSAVAAALTGMGLPEQHSPWVPHTTLLYTTDLSKAAALTDRCGPITFDRVRIAFAGQSIDIPLLAEPEQPPAYQGWIGRAYVEAAAGEGVNPMSRAQKIRDAWNTSGAPVTQWVQEARADAAIVVDDTDRTYRLVPVTFDGDTVVFGEPQVYDPEADKVLVFASRASSRPDVAADPPQDPPPAPPAQPAPLLPAAEPEQPNTDPKEDPVSTDLSAFRSRLGLDDTADEVALLAAFDAALTKAETPAEPTPEMVAASAAVEKEKDELRKEVTVLASQVQTMSTRIAAAEAEKAATVKASVIQAAADQGKFTPAEREQWEKDYDEAPAAITRILASIAPGYKVPVAASGVAGSPEPVMPSFSDDDLTDAFFGPGSAAKFKTQEA